MNVWYRYLVLVMQVNYYRYSNLMKNIKNFFKTNNKNICCVNHILLLQIKSF